MTPAARGRGTRWRMRDGTTIAIKDMTDSHLMNTIRMLWRAWDASVLECGAAISMLQGEMATFYAEREFDQMLEETPADKWPIYDDLYDEALARGLMVEGEHVPILRKRPTS